MSESNINLTPGDPTLLSGAVHDGSECPPPRDARSAHFHRHAHGDLFRAILSEDVIWDRAFEHAICEDLHEHLLQSENDCLVIQSTALRTFYIRGAFWRFNSYYFPNPRAAVKHADLIVAPNSLLYLRRVGNNIDLEGLLNFKNLGGNREGVITIHVEQWRKRYASLFREVRLPFGDERSELQSKYAIRATSNASPSSDF